MSCYFSQKLSPASLYATIKKVKTNKFLSIIKKRTQRKFTMSTK